MYGAAKQPVDTEQGIAIVRIVPYRIVSYRIVSAINL